MITLLVMYVVFGLLLIVLAIPMLRGKVPPNPWYGFRVPSTLSDPTRWYKATGDAGRRLPLTGLITAASAGALYFVPGLSVETYAWLVLAVFGVPFVLMIISSFRYLRRLPR